MDAFGWKGLVNKRITFCSHIEIFPIYPSFSFAVLSRVHQKQKNMTTMRTIKLPNKDNIGRGSINLSRV